MNTSFFPAACRQRVWGLDWIASPPPSSAVTVLAALQILAGGPRCTCVCITRVMRIASNLECHGASFQCLHLPVAHAFGYLMLIHARPTALCSITAGFEQPLAGSGSLGVHRTVEALKHAFALRMSLGERRRGWMWQAGQPTEQMGLGRRCCQLWLLTGDSQPTAATRVLCLRRRPRARRREPLCQPHCHSFRASRLRFHVISSVRDACGLPWRCWSGRSSDCHRYRCPLNSSSFSLLTSLSRRIHFAAPTSVTMLCPSHTTAGASM